MLFLFLPIKDIGDIREMISQMGSEVNKSENVNTLLSKLEEPVTPGSGTAASSFLPCLLP